VIRELKIWPEPFEEIRLGVKSFEVRRERDGGPRFEGGDVLRLREWSPKSLDYTGRLLIAHVTSILRLYDTPEAWQLRSGGFIVVMQLRLLEGGGATS
jgi:hypothetical protein